MSLYEIRVRGDANGYYAHARGATLGTEATREQAEEIVRAAINGAEWEVVEVEA